MKAISYPDIWLRIIGIPFLAIFFRHVGSREPFFDLLRTSQYYLDLVWIVAIAVLVWESNRLIIRQLDKRYSWISQRLERLMLQSSLAIGISVSEVIGLLYLYDALFITQPEPLNKGWLIASNVPLIIVFVVVLHMVYTGMYFMRYHRLVVDDLQFRLDEALRIGEKLQLDKIYNENSELSTHTYQKHLMANYGNSSIPIPSGDIAYIVKLEQRCIIKLFDGKEYTANSSLESLELLLDPSFFFRLNRQVLANVHSIRHFKQDSNGRLSVELTPPFPEEVSVSRRKAPEFKEWLGKKI